MKKISYSMICIILLGICFIKISFTQPVLLSNRDATLGREIIFINQLLGELQKARLDLGSPEEQQELENQIMRVKAIQQHAIRLFKKLD